jgi:predicted MFS family arabinose efflux permease
LVTDSFSGLIGKGRYAEARLIIVEYHANGDETHPLVNLELYEMEQSLQVQGMTSVRNFFDIRILFNTRNRRYRFMCCVAMAWFGQFSGNNIASYYLPIMIANVGIKDTNMQLLLNAVYAVTGWISATTGARFHDIVGRRKMLMGSCAGMAICLAIVAGTAAAYEHNHEAFAASRASIAFIFIFGVVFAFSFTPMQPIYPAEVLSSKLERETNDLSSTLTFPR